MYDIVVRFPSKELADEWCGQMSDGFGEGYCNFSPFREVDDPHQNKEPRYVKDKHLGMNVFYVTEIFDF